MTLSYLILKRHVFRKFQRYFTAAMSQVEDN